MRIRLMMIGLLTGLALAQGCAQAKPQPDACPAPHPCSAPPVTLQSGVVCDCDHALSELDAGPSLDAARTDASSPVDAACKREVCSLPATWNEKSCGCQTTCDLMHEVTNYVPRNGTVDCGTLALNADTTARLAAQRCILDAVSGQKPFRFIQGRRGTDSTIATGYASGGVGDLIAIFEYDGDPSGGGNIGAVIDAQYCRSLSAEPGCQVSESSDCLRCDERVSSGRVCDGRRDQSNANCFGPGNYAAGKGGEYRPCCPGLNQVQVLTAAYSGEQQEHVCVQEPLNSYACIAGRCGDGFCEAAESVVCNCPTDCPSAVWGPGDVGVDNRQ
jgi:hypothetical protein